MKLIGEVAGLYKIVPLQNFRNTTGVHFDILPMKFLPRIDSIDRVIHHSAAISPGKVGDVERPWYMHPHQDDNLMVLFGVRYVDIYTPHHGSVEHFTVAPDRIEKNGEILFEGAAMLVWPRGVFHRIRSGEQGSASINLAVHYGGFDIKTNFNIYNLSVESGDFNVIRYGYEDQTDN